MRAEQRANKQPMRYDRRWRDRDESEAPEGAPYVIRLKVPRPRAKPSIDDEVQGKVTVKNAEIDDYVLLRADGTPTYMLAVVVDDHDMGVTHIIRGDDHLNNAFRQLPVIRAMNEIEGGWPDPVYAHVPLIHGNRTAPSFPSVTARSALSAYRDEEGVLPKRSSITFCALVGAMAIARKITREEAIELFDLDGVSVNKPLALRHQEAAQNLNGHYIREADDARLAAPGRRKAGRSMPTKRFSPRRCPCSRPAPAKSIERTR